MAVDTNTRGHRQWFYFSVTAGLSRKVKMVVHAFRKKMSLFQIGMRPYGKRREEGEEGWKAVGSNVHYGRDTDRGKRINAQKRVEFSLSFEIELKKDEEFCIASCIPYSYSFLKDRLKSMNFPAVSRVEVRQEVLCKTLTGLEVPLITVNGPAASKPHRYIIINARTHPGESSASWVLDGLLRELSSSSILQGLLLEFRIVVKIVPMLNVEGVCMGNYRTGTMGMDFNRLFLSGSPDLFPEISALKRLVEECKGKGKVDMFLDLHGHSILPGCFMYGPDPVFAPKTALGRMVREMSKSQYFMRGHCVQGVDRAKAETSRIYFQAQEGVFALTCENSLGLYCKNGQKGREMQFEGHNWQ
jgi:cytosolic carboxypeptidase protein 2/3